MKRKFGHTTIEAEDIEVVSVGYSDKGYGRIYSVIIRTKAKVLLKGLWGEYMTLNHDKEIRISKAEYEALRKELYERRP